MKAQLIRELDKAGNGAKKGDTNPVGHVVDHPDAFLLVQMGVAVPLDEECRLAAGLSDAQIQKLAKRYDKLAAGMATGDARFDAPSSNAEESAEGDLNDDESSAPDGGSGESLADADE